MPRLKVGDMVVLKSGGPIMTVALLLDAAQPAKSAVCASSDENELVLPPEPTVPSARCVWFVEPRDYARRDEFPIQALRKVKVRQPRPVALAPMPDPEPVVSRYEMLDRGLR